MNTTDEHNTEALDADGELPKGDDPFGLFDEWLADAEREEPNLPTAMALATVDGTGMPNVRMVLLKGAGPDGFVFYTNTESVKGHELAENPSAALCFHWKSLQRQIRIRGTITLVSDTEADAYFKTRDRGSQIGAWASQQSRPLEGRFELEAAVAKTTARYGIGAVPRPAHWSGYRLRPTEIEFWRGRPFRLHNRLCFVRLEGETAWHQERLYP